MISCLSSWKSIKKWIPDILETTGRFSRRINPHLLHYIRSWQWRSQEKNDCVSHLSKALKAMYARWGKKKATSETPLGRCILTTLTKCRFLRRCALKNARPPQEDLPLFFSHTNPLKQQYDWFSHWKCKYIIPLHYIPSMIPIYYIWNYILAFIIGTIYYIMYSHKVPFYTIPIYPLYPHQMTIECDILLGGLNRLLVLNHGMIGWDGEHIFGMG